MERGGPGYVEVTDDLTRDFHVSNASWEALSFLRDKQKMDLVMTVGQYTQVSMMLNSFGVQLYRGKRLTPHWMPEPNPQISRGMNMSGVGVVATLTVAEGKNAEFEAVLWRTGRRRPRE